ncbi:MAG: UDP-N-acetylmuramoyl-L-alanine--D-glutamate ligase [Lachnospiraceae bacterium]|nr:UDP-N-acetylmuramoyl-L-alanine--D-glutamate ligase [Lachnospiraceae bacterium]
MILKGKKVLVYGTGLSGVAAARLLLQVGADVVIYDENEEIDQGILVATIGVGLCGNVQVLLGELHQGLVQTLDLVIMSPGVPLDIPQVALFCANQLPIWGEIELAYVLGQGDVLAITGTNGKTTTTALLGEIMKAHQANTYVVGNIGKPYTDIALETNKDTIIVAETSSFQLETIHRFRPKIAAILNITPDHLDRHHTMEAYIAAKERIAQNQEEEDVCVLNYDNENSKNFASRAKAQVIFFSTQEMVKGVYLKEGKIVCHLDQPKILCEANQLKVLGIHNLENVMAAIAMAVAYGVPERVIRQEVLAFGGVAHRIEFVTQKNNVFYYNDSKGTNPDAAIKAIQAMIRPTVLIGGGYDKDANYDGWIQAFDGKVKKLILVGETKDKIAETAKKLGFYDIVMKDTFEEAVKAGMEYAVPGDAVLLSPACASWGMFQNYEERGDKFKELVTRENIYG